jgi:hypothetical protein
MERKEEVMIPPKRPRGEVKLANALRAAARLLRAGEPVDMAVLRQAIEVQRERRPKMSAAMTDLIQAAEDDIARGDRSAALKDFRIAIELAEERPKAKGN